MIFERLAQFPNVESGEKQLHVSSAVTNYETYSIVHDARFRPLPREWDIWKKAIRQYSDENPHITDESYYRFLTHIHSLCAQFGWERLIGQEGRHKAKDWKRPMLGPRHVLALGSYVGFLNKQAFEIKEEHANRFSQEPEIQAGIYGLLFVPISGKVSIDPNKYGSDQAIVYEAKERFDEPRRILLPIFDLNEHLALLQFDGNQADQMSDNEFYDTVLPRVEPIVDAFMPGVSIDIFMREKNEAEPTYFIP